MFALPQTQDERIKCFIANRVCFADNDKAYIYRSFGRRRAGRKTRYLIHLSNGDSFCLTAENDEQAVEKANRRINALQSK